ncbi:MAG: hypothetical protein C3F13_05160 [Anaerolineales bacterium]|nr:hypothetical protein [Anaerolineae bacterium]PWB55112.1 MAG: hypothetical protein C3F13_05160 [Anaerolineales bacterium]
MIITLDEFFRGYEASKPYFEAVRVLLDTIGPTEMRVSKSQVAFWRSKAVAYLWIPARYLTGDLAPLVLTLGFDQRDESPRWKEIVEPAPGHFTHHLEIWSMAAIDDQVRDWLKKAWLNAA